MSNSISFKNDLFTKYAWGQNDYISFLLRQFIIGYLLKYELKEESIINPEIIPNKVKDKKVILDIVIDLIDRIIDIEMQNSHMNRYQYQRFQFYHSRLLVKQLREGEDYDTLKDVY